MPITLSERLHIAVVESLLILNRLTVKRSLVNHNCKTERVKCDMLERQCGAPWRLLIEERRQYSNV